FDYHALARRSLVVDSVRLRGGRVVWPIRHTNEVLHSAQINQVEGLLKFNPNDQWDLSNLSGQILGLRVQITGTLTNASLLRDWKLPKKPGKKQLSEASIRKLMETLHQIHFAGPPQITIK